MRTALLILACLLALVSPAVAQTPKDDISGDTTKWYNKTQRLKEVTIKKKRSKYSRKNNPAVELMRKVIAAKKRTHLENKDYYSYDRYQKIMFGANDVRPAEFEKGVFGMIPNILNLLEVCPYNNKLILPATFNETISKKVYRRHPHDEKEIIKAERSGGINKMFQTGEILTAALQDFFTDVNIYDDQVRLFQHPFTSPISKDAIAFYRFHIIDTLNVGTDRCVHLHFAPNNQQDFGFTGEIYILDDSSYQVRRCELSIPQKSDVNFVDGMMILQEFTPLPTGEWVLSVDDMIVELVLFDFFQKGIVIRNTRLSNYDFAAIPDSAFSGAAKTVVEKDAKRRSHDYWQANRPLKLLGCEERMDNYIEGLKQERGYKTVMLVLKTLAENFIETGTEKHPSKVDIGPINTIVTNNFIDGLRTRLSLQTTANLSRHFFVNGYYAHGWKSHKDYYKAEATYSLNPKDYLPDEFPMRNISLLSSYDVCSPSDKFLSTDKDNVFTSLKWAKVDKMMFYRRHQLKFVREEEFGLRTTVTAKLEENEACGELHFAPLSTGLEKKMRTTELRAELRYALGEKFVNTKQHRRPLNRDVPVFTLSHSIGFKGVFGGQYRYNFTEAGLFRRFWVKSWGKIDLDIKAGAQWNKVPFPLLCMPAANLSYITQYSTFGLINNMEFLNDRYASLMLTWDLNGKLFNRLPLVKKLKWREYIGVRTLWGTLTKKNNPYLENNSGSDVLMAFPEGSYVMDSNRPYVEVLAGVHNVFRFFHIEYVRRLNYLDLPTATKNGIRIKFSLKF